MNRLPLAIELLAVKYLCDAYGLAYEPVYINNNLINNSECVFCEIAYGDKYGFDFDTSSGFDCGPYFFSFGSTPDDSGWGDNHNYFHKEILNFAAKQAGDEYKLFALMFASEAE